MSRTEPITLQQLVANLSPLEIRVDTIEALRQWRRKHRGLREFNVQTNLATEFILVAGKRKNVQLPAGSTFTNLCGEFTSSTSDALVRDAIETVWWFVRCGFTIPLGSGNADVPLYYRLTRRGERFLDEHDDHPLLPGYLERIEANCPGLPEGVIPILEEARKCLDYSLLRSGVVLMGVAYEIMLDEIANLLTTKGFDDEWHSNARRLDEDQAHQGCIHAPCDSDSVAKRRGSNRGRSGHRLCGQAPSRAQSRCTYGEGVRQRG